MVRKTPGLASLTPFESLSESNRTTLSLSVERENRNKNSKSMKLVDSLDRHLALSDEYFLEGESALAASKVPTEKERPRIRCQDYNNSLASWLRSNCAYYGRDDRIRPVVWLSEKESHIERATRSEEMRKKVTKFRKPPELPSHWKPRLKVEGFENYLRPPTVRQVIAKGLVDFYDKGGELEPKPHCFKTRLALMVEHSEAANDCAYELEQIPERQRLATWLRSSHFNSFRKAVDRPFREINRVINKNNPVFEQCKQVKLYVNWLRNNASPPPEVQKPESIGFKEEEERYKYWLEKHSVLNSHRKDQRTKEEKVWALGVRRYLEGKCTAITLNALARYLFDDGRKHVTLDVPEVAGDKARKYYLKLVELYLAGRISPHRMIKAYDRMFAKHEPHPKTRYPYKIEYEFDKRIEQKSEVIAIGKPKTLYKHTFDKEYQERVRSWHKFSWNYRALRRDPLSFEPAKEPDIITKEEDNISRLISYRKVMMEEISDMVKKTIKECLPHYIEGTSNKHEHVPGYEISPFSGIYRPIT